MTALTGVCDLFYDGKYKVLDLCSPMLTYGGEEFVDFAFSALHSDIPSNLPQHNNARPGLGQRPKG